MKIGLALPHYDFSFPDHRKTSVRHVVSYAQRAERLGFDSVWVSDHLFLDIERYGGSPGRQETPDALAMCAAIAQATERVRFGTLVLCSSFRHPRMLAHTVSTLHEMSGGRFDPGIGAGWYEPEFAAAGIPFGTAGQRIERMRIVAGHLDAAFGRDVRLWVGGKGGPKVMSVVAEHAHGWNVVWRITPDELRARLDVLRGACATANRDPASVAINVGLYTLVGWDEDNLARRFERMRAWMPGIAGTSSLAEFSRGGLVGTVDECARTIKEFEALGVSEIVLGLGSMPFSVYDDEQIDFIARELLPRVR